MKPGLKKCDLTVSDCTGTAKLMLWNQDMDKLEIGKSYELKNLTVGEFNMKYLTLPKSTGLDMVALEDIGAVKDIPDDVDNPYELKNAEVVAVSRFTRGSFCISCNGKVDPINARIGKCTRCSASQRLDKCKVNMSVNILVGPNGNTRSLYAYLPMIKAIMQNETITENTNEDDIVDGLLMADPFSLK